MHKKIAKAVTGSLMAASMVASSVAAFVPMSASAGTCLGQSDFDDGIGLPWHICVTNPAEQKFTISGGTYNCTIVNPGGSGIDENGSPISGAEQRGGDSRWDCQFRHRSLHIQSGHTYKIHWEVDASEAGELHTHIHDLSGEGEGVWQNNKAQWSQGWDNVKISAGKNSFDSEFTASKTFEVAEWAFHYGGAGPYQKYDCFPEGTTLKFDNMELECTSCGDSYVSESKTPCLWDPTNELGVITPRSDVRINQVGYFAGADKKATYATRSSKSAVDFVVKDKSGKTVYEGKGKVIGEDPDAGDYCQILDFTDCTATGTGFTIEVDDKSNTYHNKKTGEDYDMWKSHEFAIGDDVYKGIIKDAMNYFYQNRSGMDIEEKYITSYNENDPGGKSKLAHKGGHAPSDNAWVQSEWKRSYGQEFDGDEKYKVDCVGGWYDAGDHGKYVVNGGISVWTLQNMYERSVAKGTDSKWNDDKTMSIPQSYSVGNISFSGSGSPDVLDEARVELEWMFNMIVSSSDPYWGSKCEGLVYHKMHDHKWTGLATKPYDYQDDWGTTRIVKPPTYAATFNMIACAAQASRLWKDFDSSFSDKCLKNAKSSWEAMMAKKSSWYGKDHGADAWKTDPQYAPLDQAIGGGGYGDTYVDDDAYWAACELYATTGDSEYYDFLKGYKNIHDGDGHDKAFDITTSLGGGENNGSFSSFNWGCTAGLGTLTLLLSDKTSAEDKATIEKNIKACADTYIDFENNSTNGMGIPYKGTEFEDAINCPGEKIKGYEWGSNSFVINNAIVMAYAYDISQDNKYFNGAVSALDYIFGRNGLGFSFVTGYGTYHSNNPHHRYWSYELDHEFPMAPDGVMSGGCGAGLQDPYVGGLGYARGKTASQKCFVDSIEAWSVNEVTINWNAPFAWAMAFFDDEGADVGNVTQTTTTTTTAPTPTTTTTTVKDVTATKWGDANCDGGVDMADAVLIMQSISNPNKYGLSGSDSHHITEQGKANA
ncbi:MAG: glycoside hydrolase family 9 protein, partial [Ruminococcus sp.]|nr:glycoside hydrolase family 9 protein [Ruminococcus sp.]